MTRESMKCCSFISLCFLLNLTTDRIVEVFSQICTPSTVNTAHCFRRPLITMWVALPSRMLYRSARLSQWGVDGLNHRNVWSHSSGGQKSKIKVSTGLVVSEGCEERIFSRFLSLACRWMFSSCVSSHCLASVHTPVVKAPLCIRTPVLSD